VAAAVEGAYACLEVVHSTWTGYRFNLEQNTADNASAGQVVVGPRLPVTDLMALDTVAVRLHDGSGHTLGQGVGADADGHPLGAVARLARELAAFGQRLDAGDLGDHGWTDGGLCAGGGWADSGHVFVWGRLVSRCDCAASVKRHLMGAPRLHINPINDRVHQGRQCSGSSSLGQPLHYPLAARSGRSRTSARRPIRSGS
jgi:hypothetical protein